MRIAILLVGLMFLSASYARCDTPAPPINGTGVDQPLAAHATVDQVLDALDQRGRGLKDFSAKVSITQGDPTVSVSTRTGQVWFQVKGIDDGRIRVTFDKQIEGKITRDEKLDYLLDNGLLIDRNYRKSSETRRQVLKPGEKINLLKLGDGPFPLPIGQKKEDVYKLFDVKQIARRRTMTRNWPT